MRVLFLFISLSIGLPAQTDLEKRVDAAISRGCKALISSQRPDGGFSAAVGDHCLSLLALLHSKVDKKSPAIQRAMRPLRRNPGTNYERAVRLMAIELLREPGLRVLAAKDVEDLVHNQAMSGGWDYNQPGERTDNSCTQYALLGLRAADKLGMQTPRSVWKKALKYLIGQQARDGGAGYQRNQPSSASMTSGVVSSLVAAVARGGYRENDVRRARVKRSIDRATTWLAEHWRPGQGAHAYYTFYGLERAMAFSGQDRMGTRDWYAEGATYLLKGQRKDGWWGRAGDVRTTAFALLFLSRDSKPTSGETPGSVSLILGSLSPQSQASDTRAAVIALKKKGRGCCSLLVHYLSDPLKARRKASVRALREITGKTFGYDVSLSVADNAAAIADWKKAVVTLGK